MNKVIVGFVVVIISFVFVGCAEQPPKASVNNNQAEWQQFKAKKAQDELAAEVAKQKAANQ